MSEDAERMDRALSAALHVLSNTHTPDRELVTLVCQGLGLDPEAEMALWAAHPLRASVAIAAPPEPDVEGPGQLAVWAVAGRVILRLTGANGHVDAELDAGEEVTRFLQAVETVRQQAAAQAAETIEGPTRS